MSESASHHLCECLTSWRRHAQKFELFQFSTGFEYYKIRKDINIALLVQKLQQFCWTDRFCLLVIFCKHYKKVWPVMSASFFIICGQTCKISRASQACLCSIFRAWKNGWLWTYALLIRMKISIVGNNGIRSLKRGVIFGIKEATGQWCFLEKCIVRFVLQSMLFDYLFSEPCVNILTFCMSEFGVLLPIAGSVFGPFLFYSFFYMYNCFLFSSFFLDIFFFFSFSWYWCYYPSTSRSWAWIVLFYKRGRALANVCCISR